jgi:hypothetical protein
MMVMTMQTVGRLEDAKGSWFVHKTRDSEQRLIEIQRQERLTGMSGCYLSNALLAYTGYIWVSRVCVNLLEQTELFR